MSENIKFVPNPYTVGGSMREDVFSVQFSVYVELEIDLLDNDQVSTYSRSCSHFVGGAPTVSEAVELANQFLKQHSHDNALDAIAGKYICPEEDCLEWSSAQSVRVYDREHRLVVGGTVAGSTITWVKPAISISEMAEVEAEIAALLSEASFEAGWDNYSTAKGLRRSAEKLRWKLSPSPIVRTPYFAQELAHKELFSNNY